MKTRLLLFLSFLSLSLSSGYVLAQEKSDSMTIHYRRGHRYVDPDYRNNRAELNHFIESVRQSMREGILQSVTIRSYASPDGGTRANIRLAQLRVDSLSAYLTRATHLPDGIVKKESGGIAWELLRNYVAASDMADRDEVLHILDHTPVEVYDENGKLVDGRKHQLMNLNGGKTYRYMADTFFPDLRSGVSAYLNVDRSRQIEPDPEPETVIEDSAPADMEPEPEPLVETRSGWIPKLAVKTNAIGWAMFAANIALEVDLSRHFSLQVPVYFSAANYFSSTTKFRLFGTQPELRYWPSEKRNFFVGAHFGVASYNFALGGKDHRIQDHDGKTPALGGGLALGYRMPLGQKKRWCVEFSAGAGAYRAHFDKFVNEKNGEYLSTKKKTFVGLDHLAVSFAYLFDLKK